MSVAPAALMTLLVNLFPLNTGKTDETRQEKNANNALCSSDNTTKLIQFITIKQLLNALKIASKVIVYPHQNSQVVLEI
jgi:hypothetical protein